MKFLCVSAFFETQRQGRWAWPWLLLGIILGIFGLVASDSLYYWILYFLAQYLEIQWIVDFYYTETHTTPPHLILMLLGVGIPFWAAAIVGTLVQGRSVKSLMSPLYGFRWGLVGKSFLVVSLVTALLSVIPGTGSDVPKLEFTGIGKEHIIG